MRSLIHTPLTAPRHFVGTVDATYDTQRATARCLEQLQGHQRSAIAQIVPMADPARHHRAADWALYAVFLIALIVIGATA